MARQENTTCINCGNTLPDRYKGRARIYCSPNCRKEYIKKKEARA